MELSWATVTVAVPGGLTQLPVSGGGGIQNSTSQIATRCRCRHIFLTWLPWVRLRRCASRRRNRTHGYTQDVLDMEWSHSSRAQILGCPGTVALPCRDARRVAWDGRPSMLGRVPCSRGKRMPCRRGTRVVSLRAGVRRRRRPGERRGCSRGARGRRCSSGRRRIRRRRAAAG